MSGHPHFELPRWNLRVGSPERGTPGVQPLRMASPQIVQKSQVCSSLHRQPGACHPPKYVPQMGNLSVGDRDGQMSYTGLLATAP